MFSLKIFRTTTYWRTNYKILRGFHKIGDEILNKVTNLEDVRSQQSEDILQKLKSATDASEIFNILSFNGKRLNSQEIMQSFRTLFNLQKTGNSSLETTEIIKHPKFEELCINLRRNSRSLEVNEIIEALKIFSYIGVSVDSNIVYILLNFLRQHINDLTLGHIIFLDFLFKKFDDSPLIEALKIALPMVFQIQLNTQIDHDNIPELIELLAYSSHNRISDKCVMNIISALILHGDNFNVNEAKNILWSLTDIKPFKPFYEKLLNNVFKSLNKNNNNFMELKLDNLLTTTSKIIRKIQQKQYGFYNEEFLNKTATYAIEMDIGFNKGTAFLQKFNKINFVNISLLDYLCEKILQDPNMIINTRPSYYFSIISGLSTANYQPKEWEKIQLFLLQNSVMEINTNELPWTKFCIELISLNCFDKNFIENLFNTNFLEKFLSREQNTLDYLQLLLVYQSVMILFKNSYDGILPEKRFIDRAIELNLDKNHNNFKDSLKTFLEYIFDDDKKYILSNLTTNYGHSIDYCIVFNREDQQPVSLQELFKTNDDTNYDQRGFLNVEDLLDLNENYKIISIFNFPPSHYALNFPRLKGIFELKLKTLEAIGISTVAIHYQKLIELPEKERLPFLEREIRSKIK